ncbi:hypothetical protein BN961_04013 [Afipia felis]|uniref:Uncharacterized protein n=1 Tax=Afipia felis TaxID=1035 RepID=A0A090N8V2_AFIFE|nr:hypothetical protein BN961_04013 [Afipia felis]
MKKVWPNDEKSVSRNPPESQRMFSLIKVGLLLSIVFMVLLYRNAIDEQSIHA